MKAIENKDALFIPSDINSLTLMVGVSVLAIEKDLESSSKCLSSENIFLNDTLERCSVFFVSKKDAERSMPYLESVDKNNELIAKRLGAIGGFSVCVIRNDYLHYMLPWLFDEHQQTKVIAPELVFKYRKVEKKLEIGSPSNCVWMFSIWLPNIRVENMLSIIDGCLARMGEGPTYFLLPNRDHNFFIRFGNEAVVEKSVSDYWSKKQTYNIDEGKWIRKGRSGESFNSSKEPSERNDVVVSLVDKGKRVNIRFYNNSWKVIADKEDKKFIKVQIVKDRMYFCKGNERNYKLVTAGKNPHISLTATKEVKEFEGEANLMYDKDNNLYYIEEPNPFH